MADIIKKQKSEGAGCKEGACRGEGADCKELAEGAEVEVLNNTVPIEEKRGAGGFFSFSYSYNSMTSSGGRTHIKSKKMSYSDGKIESEEFEGTTDGDVFTESARRLQDAFTEQLTSIFRPFANLLPFSSNKKREGK